MDLDRLVIFREIVRCGGIAAAARAAGRDPSAVSRAIAALEANLGVRLIQRTTRSHTLTEAGETYLRRIEPILDELSSAREEVQGLVERPRGRLRVTASSAFGQTVLAPELRSFQAAYPDVEVELVLTDALVDLVAERIDVGIRLGPRPEGDLITARLRTTQMHLIASPERLDAVEALRSPWDVAAYPALITSTHNLEVWSFGRSDGEDLQVPVRGRIATSNTLVVKRCALDGLGLAVLADWLVDEELADGRLIRLLPDWRVGARGFDTGVWVVYPSRRFLPSKARAFIDHLRAQLQGPRSDPVRLDGATPPSMFSSDRLSR